MVRHISITVSGKVQGVFFRASAKQKADELNLKGFVQNLPDGKVYMEAEGPEENLNLLKHWCSIGPPRARVEQAEIKEGEPKGFSNFKVLP